MSIVLSPHLTNSFGGEPHLFTKRPNAIGLLSRARLYLTTTYARIAALPPQTCKHLAGPALPCPASATRPAKPWRSRKHLPNDTHAFPPISHPGLVTPRGGKSVNQGSQLPNPDPSPPPHRPPGRRVYVCLQDAQTHTSPRSLRARPRPTSNRPDSSSPSERTLRASIIIIYLSRSLVKAFLPPPAGTGTPGATNRRAETWLPSRGFRGFTTLGSALPSRA